MQPFPISRFQQLPTPFYFYDLALLRETLDSICSLTAAHPFKVHYAVKANANPRILSMISARGFGADIVSGGELKVAKKAGFRPQDMVFSGVGKADWEIELALREGVGCLNIESREELEVVAQIADRLGCRARVALRVNPDIDAHTHHYITTGLQENKFGISLQHLDGVVARALSLPALDLCGLHFHIGSQVTITEPFRILCDKIADLLRHFSASGISFSSINVGGGLGIDYDSPDENPIPDFAPYFQTFARSLPLDPHQTLHFELGRSIVAQCGSLISRVLYVKEGIDKKFCIIDAGMTELIRPALYQAHHRISNLTSPSAQTGTYDVVGPVCESSDVFATDLSLPLTRRGDLLAVRSAGAYGEAMSSAYNCRSLNPPCFFPD